MDGAIKLVYDRSTRSTTTIPGLTAGRIVHYTLSEQDGVHPRAVGKVRPAIVVEPWDGEGLVNLHVFLNGTNDRAESGTDLLWATSREFDGSGKPGTWRWPRHG